MRISLTTIHTATGEDARRRATRSTAARHSAALAAFLLIGAAGACSGNPSPQATPPTVDTQLSESAAPSPAVSGDSSAEPSSAPKTSTKPSPGYPKDAKAYAVALLEAWASHDGTRLSELADQSTVQQIADNGFPNAQWGYVRCDEASGTVECHFRNAHGDEVKIVLSAIQLGHPTAVVEALLDKTTYPTSAGDYVNNFVHAWQQGNKQRMARLSSGAVADQLAAKTPPSAYGTSTDGTAGHTKVGVNPIGDGTAVTLNVDNTKLGAAHAVVGICDPTCA